MMKLLVIDDEQAICSSIRFALEDEYEVWTATEVETGLALMKEHRMDAVLLDLRIGKDSGLDCLPQLKAISPEVVVIMMTAYGSIDTSIRAMKEGAYHYATKPLNLEEIKLLLEKGLQFKRLHSVVHPQTGYAGIIGQSQKMTQVFELIRKVKDIDSNVLIMGESGTGKELVARAIHQDGARRSAPFSVINCAAIPEALLESELFGYEKGAFTGATMRKAGLFEQSHQGTIFLDEIGEMPFPLQAKILRVIQEREITPLGSAQRKEVDVRILSATHRDLQEEVRKGNFREDLYYRLNVIPVTLPALRERPEDIPLLIGHFLEVYALRMGRPSLALSHQAKELLYSYTFPGNVRELSNIMEYAVAMSEGEVLEVRDLPAGLSLVQGSQPEEGRSVAGLFLPSGLPLAEVEKRYILHTLDECGGQRKRTADQLQISERGLRDKLKKYREGEEEE